MTAARSRQLPPDSAARATLHDEVHARPVARIRIPALVTHIAVLNRGIPVEREHEHLRALVEAQGARMAMHEPGFVRVRLETFTVKWERHGEFSRYSITQPLDQAAIWGADDPDLVGLIAAPADWMGAIPGETISALQVVLLRSAGENDEHASAMAQSLLGGGRIAGSAVKDGSARLYTNYLLRADGYSRFVLLCDEVTEGRSGRMTASLVEMETYRMMALMAFPLARALGVRLALLEARLAELTRAIDEATHEDAYLLNQLMQVAAEVETEIAAHSARFSASTAYYGIVQQRIDDLREASVPGVTGVFTFLQRRLVPAMATVEAAGKRLAALSERTSRASDLLRTRVDITTESQNQELLKSLGRGQRLQLRLQETVEGLSIAAISYYLVGLLGYAGKAAKASGVPLNVDLFTGAMIPVAVFSVWWTLRRIRARIHARTKD